MTSKDFDRSRSKETPADDEYERDDHRGWMSEPSEDFILRDDTTEVRDDEGAESDHVVPHAPPQEQSKDCREEEEQEYLIGGHEETPR
jgi:hypothetical protein